jgi:hypothetical protein
MSTFCPRIRTRSESVVTAVPFSATAYIERHMHSNRLSFIFQSTFEVGVPKTLKLP